MCYTLNRKAFHDILGPIEDIWRYEALRKVENDRSALSMPCLNHAVAGFRWEQQSRAARSQAVRWRTSQCAATFSAGRHGTHLQRVLLHAAIG